MRNTINRWWGKLTREGAQEAIVEKNDYYAFGLGHGITSGTSGVNYNYEYNGRNSSRKSVSTSTVPDSICRISEDEVLWIR